MRSSRSSEESRRSLGVVILRFSDEDSTIRTRPPARSTSHDSSVARPSTSAETSRARSSTDRGELADRQGDDDLFDLGYLTESVDAPLHHRPASQDDERLGSVEPKAFTTTRGHDQRDRHRWFLSLLRARDDLRLGRT